MKNIATVILIGYAAACLAATPAPAKKPPPKPVVPPIVLQQGSTIKARSTAHLMSPLQEKQIQVLHVTSVIDMTGKPVKLTCTALTQISTSGKPAETIIKPQSLVCNSKLDTPISGNILINNSTIITPQLLGDNYAYWVKGQAITIQLTAPATIKPKP